jgi:hypothetical protein
MGTTWSSTGSRSVKAVFTTGTESAPSAPALAAQTVAFSSAVAGNTVTVRGMTFTAIANGSTPATTQEFAVGTGASADTDTGAAFAAAVNANKSILGVTATNASGTVTLTATDYGATVTNAYTLAKVGDPITLGGNTFASGVDPVGVALKDVGSLSVRAQAAAGQTIAGGSLTCYVLDDRAGIWLKYPDGDLTPGSAYRGFAWALGVTVPHSRIAWVPTGVTISSGSMTLYIDALEPDNRAASGRLL